MKRFVLIFAIAAVLMNSEAWAGKKKDVISKEPGSVTFRVDLNLPKPENLYWEIGRASCRERVFLTV